MNEPQEAPTRIYVPHTAGHRESIPEDAPVRIYSPASSAERQAAQTP